MMVRLLASCILFLTAFASADGDEPVGTSFSRLKRLHAVLERVHAVLEHPSFPSPTQDGIQTWKQGTGPHGTAVKFDLDKVLVDSRTGAPIRRSLPDEIPLQTIFQFRGGIGMRNDIDMENVVIISNNGRSIDFVDLRIPGKNTFVSDVVVNRGDVVAFLRTENVK